jgi:multimeric flavodoxin WrbA
MPIHILGISGSPVEGGNTEAFLSKALDVARGEPDVSAEMISLAGKDISDCQHCNWCLRKQEDGKYCVQQDDMKAIYPRILEADCPILATPVYIGRLSGYLAALLDRLRVFVHGNIYRGRLMDKIAGAMAVGWYRHAGLESTLQSIVIGILAFNMIPVGSSGCPWGAPAVATQGGSGRFDKERRHGVLDDEYGMMAAESLVKRMISLGRKFKE